MQYRIGIPSYRRANSQKTLDLLERIGVPKQNIIMSVQSLDDLHDYEEAGIPQRVDALIYREGKNVADNMNTLLDYFNRKERVIIIEDDIKNILRLNVSRDGRRRKLVPIETAEQLEDLCDFGFTAAKISHTIAFGLSMNRNAMFMEEGFHSRRLCDTTFFGIINNGIRFDERFEILQDTELCLRLIRTYGAMVSLNSYCTEQKRRAQGGCQEAWAKTGAREDAALLLQERYGNLISVDLGKENFIHLRREAKRQWKRGR